MTDLSTIVNLLTEHDGFEILTHRYPDGDTLGSAYALCHILQGMGKNARVITSGIPAKKYDYLREGLIEQDFVREYVVSVDVAAPELLGDNQQEYQDIIDLCIDHHGTNSMRAKHIYVDATAAAAAEIIYEIAECMQIEYTPQIANCIYTAISTDTGCFRYSNTTGRTHRIAAKMMEHTPNWFDINTQMFEVKTKDRLSLERMVYETLEYCCDGRCAIIHTTLEMQQKAGVTDDEMEGLASIPRRIEGVLLGLTAREKADGTFKVSARSNGDVDASAFCGLFGGGGHKAASGCTVTGDLESVKAQLIRAAEQIL